MDVMQLEIQVRDGSQKAKDLLKSSIIPVEYYGKGVENQSLQVDYQTFRKLFRAAGTNTVVELVIEGKEKKNVLVHHVDFHPVTDQMTHIEFIHVNMGEEIQTQVPLEFEGVSPAVKELGGTLVHNLDYLDVKCLPKDLLHSFTVNIESIVDFHSAIRVKDLVLPSAVTVLTDLEELVVSASAPQAEEVDEPVESTDEATDESAKNAPSEESAA